MVAVPSVVPISVARTLGPSSRLYQTLKEVKADGPLTSPTRTVTLVAVRLICPIMLGGSGSREDWGKKISNKNHQNAYSTKLNKLLSSHLWSKSWMLLSVNKQWKTVLNCGIFQQLTSRKIVQLWKCSLLLNCSSKTLLRVYFIILHASNILMHLPLLWSWTETSS